ncbi:MAG: hypothetical protein Q8K70_10065 [Bacteroidota bacterium]|nr:hypothetical protein [Bacteroidota bacterium]
MKKSIIIAIILFSLKPNNLKSQAYKFEVEGIAYTIKNNKYASRRLIIDTTKLYDMSSIINLCDTQGNNSKFFTSQKDSVSYLNVCLANPLINNTSFVKSHKYYDCKIKDSIKINVLNLLFVYCKKEIEFEIETTLNILDLKDIQKYSLFLLEDKQHNLFLYIDFVRFISANNDEGYSQYYFKFRKF